MSRPYTAFDAPQFPLIPDTHARSYANVSNELSIEARGCDDNPTVPIVIPASLFTIMKDVLKIAPESDVFLYLTDHDEYYVFGIAWNGMEFTDLWYYSESNLPDFLKAAVVS